MYSNSDFERFFIRYKAEAVPAGESMQKFCFRNKLPYNLFEKWYKDTRHKLVPVHVEGAPASLTESTSRTKLPFSTIIRYSPYHGGYSDDQRYSYSTAKFKLRWSKTLGREVGGFMLSITGLNQFYYLRGFHDMRCKYERVLSIIHQQLDREPQAGDVFIVMSKTIGLSVCSATTAVLTACMRNVLSPVISLCMSSLKMTCLCIKSTGKMLCCYWKVL